MCAGSGLVKSLSTGPYYTVADSYSVPYRISGVLFTLSCLTLLREVYLLTDSGCKHTDNEAGEARIPPMGDAKQVLLSAKAFQNAFQNLNRQKDDDIYYFVCSCGI